MKAAEWVNFQKTPKQETATQKYSPMASKPNGETSRRVISKIKGSMYVFIRHVADNQIQRGMHIPTAVTELSPKSININYAKFYIIKYLCISWTFSCSLGDYNTLHNWCVSEQVLTLTVMELNNWSLDCRFLSEDMKTSFSGVENGSDVRIKWFLTMFMNYPTMISIFNTCIRSFWQAWEMTDM